MLYAGVWEQEQILNHLPKVDIGGGWELFIINQISRQAEIFFNLMLALSTNSAEG